MAGYETIWSERLGCWIMAPDSADVQVPIGLVDINAIFAPRPAEPLPFFLDPEQIAAMTPEIDWDRRVGDRIRSFLDWGRGG